VVGGRQRKKRRWLGFIRAEFKKSMESAAIDARQDARLWCERRRNRPVSAWNKKRLYAITPITIQPGDHDDTNDEW